MLKIVDNKIADVDDLKKCLIGEWVQFDQSIVDAAISQWRRHQVQCLCTAYAAHSAHKFWQF